MQIRLFGDPLARGSEVPKLSINLSVGVKAVSDGVVHVPDHDVIPNFVDSWAFGSAIGVGVQSSGGWWTVTGVKIRDDTPSKVC